MSYIQYIIIIYWSKFSFAKAFLQKKMLCKCCVTSYLQDLYNNNKIHIMI